MKAVKVIALLSLVLFIVGCSAEEPVQDPGPGEVRVVVGPEKDTTYTLEDISTHDSETDCWMEIDGNVYDVTDYIPEHNSKILTGCGKEATEFFDAIPKHDGKKDLLEPYYIGTLES